MRIPHDTHVLVADGRKLLFFRNTGDAEHPSLELVRHAEHADLADHDLKSDAAGCASGGVGGSGNSMSETNFHDQEESRFATEAAAMLRKRALAGEFEKLLIIAPAKTLGELRKHYHKEVEARLVGEIAKDLTGHPVEQIARIIADQ